MVIDPDAVGSALSWTFGGAGAVIGAAFAFRKAFSQWRGIDAEQRVTEWGSRASAAGNVAVTAVYETLTREVSRLAESNTKLSAEVLRLQEEVVNLQRENAGLRAEIVRLTTRIDATNGVLSVDVVNS